MNAVQTTSQTQSTPRTPAQVKHANAHSASRAKTLLSMEGYSIKQIDAFTFLFVRPGWKHVADGIYAYTVDCSRLNEGVVTCDCQGTAGWGDCCHAQLFKQAFEAGKVEADARAFTESAPVVPVTASHAAPASDAPVCKKKGCAAPVGTSSSCIANRYCAKCQRFADFGE